MIYSCCTELRRIAVLKNPALNGIDFLEVLDHDAIPLNSPRQQTLFIHCLKTLTVAVGTDNVLIQGGESVTDVGVEWVSPALSPPASTSQAERTYFASLTNPGQVLVVRTTKTGDFSPYTLLLVTDASMEPGDAFAVTEVLAGFDPQLAAVQFSFKVECGPNFDCAPAPGNCATALPPPPPINYLAKDYGSFRSVMLDRLNQLLPNWGGTSEADIGIALAELIAYAGDSLSYQQDAVATEAYLETARKRISLRRHALLVDYHVHDGCNARAWMQLNLSGNPGAAVKLDQATTRFYTFAPGMPSSLAVGANTEEAALLSGVQVFEPLYDAFLYPEHNQMSFYTWGETNCCLPAGATEATLLGPYPRLKPGDVLVFQEVKGPQTGDPADADIRHRCAVRLTSVAVLSDPLFDQTGAAITGPTQIPMPVTEIKWFAEDALPFPVCLSSSYLDDNSDLQTVLGVSLVYGNVVLADHGLTISGRSLGQVPAPKLNFPANPAADRCQPALPTPVPVRFRPQVPDSPLTQAVPVEMVALTGSGNPVTSGVVVWGANSTLTLPDANGFNCLTLHCSDQTGWPQYFGVVANPNTTNPGNYDIAIVYNPPGGAVGIPNRVVVEKFANLPLPLMATQINSQSHFLRVPASYQPPTSAGPLPSSPTMLSNTGSVNLLDLNSQLFLTMTATGPSAWSSAFGVSAQVDTQNAITFDLLVQYSPAAGLGVTVPVTLESFTQLTLGNVVAQINSTSLLIQIDSAAQTATSGLSAYELSNYDPQAAVPVVTLYGTLNSLNSTWTAQQDLLENGESDTVFVAEVESNGAATLRFGDNVNGRTPDTGMAFTTDYRIGNGTAGNVGADSLIYLAATDARILACRNPLPAAGGVDPETNDQIRRRAPQAFLTQERAVTMADYAAETELNPQVDQSVASLRWTGSWYTVFVAVEPKGGGLLNRPLARTLKQNLERYRLAGQDLELNSPLYVSLEITLQICVDPDYFQSDVVAALQLVLSNRRLPDGQTGVFYPDNFTFGQTVYLSPVYAAARSVAGVLTVVASVFQPQGSVPTGQYLDAGEIKLGPLQVARLDNDRNYPDHGRLTIKPFGGKP